MVKTRDIPQGEADRGWASLRCDPEIKVMVRAAARREDRSIMGVVNRALRQYCEQSEREHEQG